MTTLTPLRLSLATALAAVLLCAVSITAIAQPLVVPSRSAVTLRRIWTAAAIRDGQYIGHGVAALGDINDDSLADFAVGDAVAGIYAVFHGDRPTPGNTPAFRFASKRAPVVGRFHGDERRHIVGVRTIDPYHTEELVLTPIVAGTADHERSVRIPDVSGNQVRQMLVRDIDLDGDDELILRMFGRRSGDSMLERETRIYAGGPGFTALTPTLVLPDTAGLIDDAYTRITVAELDGDGRLDLLHVTAGSSGTLMSIYWGDLLGEAGPRWPDRVVPVPWRECVVLDCDGDDVDDIAAEQVRIYRSGSGKSARTRAFDDADADQAMRMSVAVILNSLHVGGYLNDRRYAALITRSGDIARDETVYLLSGGPSGPDETFEGAVRIGRTGTTHGEPIGDCNGDGWEDYLSGGAYTSGSAAIVAGGPYIPRMRTNGAVDLAVEGRADAVSLWPQPATTELNIAWRGDLHRWPRRVVVRDLNGAMVAYGSIDDGAPAARWDCSDAPSGVYLVSLYDAGGRAIATARIIKR